MREPRPGPGIGRELTVPQQLACALRILAYEGWRENLDGHISWAVPDGSMWVNPWGVWWDEVRTSQIIRVDTAGNVVEGDWDVTGAISIHTELHRARRDATVVVHNHPYYATLLAAMGEFPRMVHQNSCVFHDELAFVDEYTLVEGEADGRWLAERLGKASGVLLGHHGAIVTAPTIEDACYRAATFERMCRFTYDILAAGRTPVEIAPAQRVPLKKLLNDVTGRPYWEGAVRMLIAANPKCSNEVQAQTGGPDAACSPHERGRSRMNMSIDDLAASEAFGGGKARRGTITWLPEPAPRERVYTVISVDDHVVEPPDAFTGRFPKQFADEEPRVVETDDGGEAWVWQGRELPNVGFNAVVGRPSSEYGFEPTRFDEMRRGAWDVNARVADMDVDGVYASLCFPSFLPGFVGQRLTLWPGDADLALAAMRAYNGWHLDAWCGAHPDRFVPNQIAYLRDPEIAADEIRRNAARGFKAVTFSEAPDKLGLPTIHSGHWDPLFAACAETGTVLCLHVGSSGTSPTTSADAPPEIPAVLFGAYGMYSAVDWLYSKVPVRFPDLRICLSEGGIGWVAGILDRLDHCYRYQLGYLPTWRDVGVPPSEVMRRNFWFCALDDDAGMLLRDRIGVDHILVESDYPHADSSWPDTQAMLTRQLRDQGVPHVDARRITWQNASELFRHPVPAELQR